MVTPRRARLTGIAVLVATFAVGGLIGAATVRVVGADEPAGLRRGFDRHAPPDLLEQLSLSDEQRVQVDRILERRRAQMEAFWSEHRPTLRAIADSARLELRALLTPEQQELERRFMLERREHFEKRERRDPRW